MNDIKVYGITGGAGTGKSEVMRMLRDDFGGLTVVTDEVARENERKGHCSYNKIVNAFGTDFLDSDGEIDRQKLAQLVFNDEEKMRILNQATRDDVRDEVKKKIEYAKYSKKYNFVAIESAILLGHGDENLFDEIWYVHTDPSIRRIRLKETRGYSDEKIDSIIRSQDNDSELLSRCQFVIENNGKLSDVYEQLSRKLKNA